MISDDYVCSLREKNTVIELYPPIFGKCCGAALISFSAAVKRPYLVCSTSYTESEEVLSNFYLTLYPHLTQIELDVFKAQTPGGKLRGALVSPQKYAVALKKIIVFPSDETIPEFSEKDVALTDALRPLILKDFQKSLQTMEVLLTPKLKARLPFDEKFRPTDFPTQEHLSLVDVGDLLTYEYRSESYVLKKPSITGMCLVILAQEVVGWSHSKASMLQWESLNKYYNIHWKADLANVNYSEFPDRLRLCLVSLKD